jgi:hypothetical protein
MEKTLLDLVEVLKSRDLKYAIYNWTSEDSCTHWFDSCVYFTLGDKLVSSKEVAPIYQDEIEHLLQEHYPDFDMGAGTYGEIYVYPFGKVEIVLTKRILSEEYHRKDVDLSSTHSSVG